MPLPKPQRYYFTLIIFVLYLRRWLGLSFNYSNLSIFRQPDLSVHLKQYLIEHSLRLKSVQGHSEYMTCLPYPQRTYVDEKRKQQIILSKKYVYVLSSDWSFSATCLCFMGFPWLSSKNPLAMQEPAAERWVGKSPVEESMATHLKVFLPGEPNGT